MSAIYIILLIGYLLASYIHILYHWFNLKRKIKTEVDYMMLQMIINSVSDKIKFFNSYEWKVYLAIAFLLLAPFIFIFTLFSMPRAFIKKLKRKKQPVEVPEPAPPVDSVDEPGTGAPIRGIF